MKTCCCPTNIRVKLLLHLMPYKVLLFLVIILFSHEYHAVIETCVQSFFNTTNIGSNLICLIFNSQYCQISFKYEQKCVWILFEFIPILFYNIVKYHFNFRHNLPQSWLNSVKYTNYFLYIGTYLSTKSISKNIWLWLKPA